MQAILKADYSFTPLEYWKDVSVAGRKFIQRCLTIDSSVRMTAHEALTHPWITGEGEGVKGGKADLLPVVKKNFNARRTLHAAIDTVRAINQLRAGGAAAMGNKDGRGLGARQAKDDGDKMEGVIHSNMPEQETVKEGVGQLEADPRGNARGQTEEQIRLQQQRIQETAQGLWSRR